MYVAREGGERARAGQVAAAALQTWSGRIGAAWLLALCGCSLDSAPVAFWPGQASGAAASSETSTATSSGPTVRGMPPRRDQAGTTAPAKPADPNPRGQDRNTGRPEATGSMPEPSATDEDAGIGEDDGATVEEEPPMQSEPEPPPPAAPPPAEPLAEGRCDLPACVPAEIRACRGRGACSRGGVNGSRICYDNGVEVVQERGPFGERITVLNEDGSTCFTVGLATDTATGEVGASYRNERGDTVAVAGRSGGFWGFLCPEGGSKVFELLSCGLISGLPPGVGGGDSCSRDGC